jgi:hypothetical protein
MTAELTPAQDRSVGLALRAGRMRRVVDAARAVVTSHDEAFDQAWEGLCQALEVYDGLRLPTSARSDGDPGPVGGSGDADSTYRVLTDPDGLGGSQGEYPPLDAAPCYGSHIPGRDGCCARCEQVVPL